MYRDTFSTGIILKSLLKICGFSLKSWSIYYNNIKSNFVFDFNTQLAFFSYEKMNHQQLTRIISNGPYPESSKCYMKTCLWPFSKFFWPQNAVVFIGKDEYWINKNNKKWEISEMKNNWKSFLDKEKRLFLNIFRVTVVAKWKWNN